MALQLTQRLGAGQPLGGVLLLLDALRARLAGAPLVAVGLRPKVLRRLGLDAALGVAAVVDAGLVAVPLKRGIRQLAPPRPLPVGHVLDLGPLAVDGVKLHGLLAQRAVRLDVARRKHDVRVPVAVMPPPGFRVGLVVLVGVLFKLPVGDGARRV